MFFLPERHYVEAGGRGFIVLYDPVTQDAITAYPAPRGAGLPFFVAARFRGRLRNGVLCYNVPIVNLFAGRRSTRRVCVEVSARTPL